MCLPHSGQNPAVLIFPLSASGDAPAEHRLKVATLTDAQQALFAARGILTGHQAQPGSQLPRILERTRVADGADQCGAVSGPIPGMLSKR